MDNFSNNESQGRLKAYKTIPFGQFGDILKNFLALMGFCFDSADSNLKCSECVFSVWALKKMCLKMLCEMHLQYTPDCINLRSQGEFLRECNILPTRSLFTGEWDRRETFIRQINLITNENEIARLESFNTEAWLNIFAVISREPYYMGENSTIDLGNVDRPMQIAQNIVDMPMDFVGMSIELSDATRELDDLPMVLGDLPTMLGGMPTQLGGMPTHLVGMPVKLRGNTEQMLLNSKIQDINTWKKERTCRVCLQRDRVVLFLPCSHLAACSVCSSTMRACPICNCAFGATIKINQT